MTTAQGMEDNEIKVRTYKFNGSLTTHDGAGAREVTLTLPCGIPPERFRDALDAILDGVASDVDAYIAADVDGRVWRAVNVLLDVAEDRTQLAKDRIAAAEALLSALGD